jgi:hypothetical protein
MWVKRGEMRAARAGYLFESEAGKCRVRLTERPLLLAGGRDGRLVLGKKQDLSRGTRNQDIACPPWPEACECLVSTALHLPSPCSTLSLSLSSSSFFFSCGLTCLDLSQFHTHRHKTLFSRGAFAFVVARHATRTHLIAGPTLAAPPRYVRPANRGRPLSSSTRGNTPLPGPNARPPWRSTGSIAASKRHSESC